MIYIDSCGFNRFCNFVASWSDIWQKKEERVLVSRDNCHKTSKLSRSPSTFAVLKTIAVDWLTVVTFQLSTVTNVKTVKTLKVQRNFSF